MKYFIIFNPGARGGRSRKILGNIKSYFSLNNLEYDMGITETLDHAYRLSADANRKGYHTIIAAGGDGTINKVLNGFYNESGKRTSHAKFGILYTGTSPDFCKSYGVPYKNIMHSLKTIRKGKIRKIEVGKIILARQFIPGMRSITKNNADFITRYFGCCANIGLGATLARAANSGIRKLLGDVMGTFVSLIKTLAVFRPVEIICKVNGIKQKIQGVYNISIGKTYYIASGIKVKNTLAQGDGLFYNLVIKDLSLFSCPSCIRAVYSGNKIVNNKNITFSYNSEIEIESPGQNVEVEFDGDPQGFLPCYIETAEDTLDLITGGGDG